MWKKNNFNRKVSCFKRALHIDTIKKQPEITSHILTFDSFPVLVRFAYLYKFCVESKTRD